MVTRAKELTAFLNIQEIRREKAARCKASFAYFLRQAWPVIEPSRPLIWGIHTEASCVHLQALADGEIHRLVANIAPGFGKSSMFSVAFPAWVWIRNPYERFLCASYAMDLAIRDNRNCRVLIESEWYQSLFGDVFAMAGDQNVKGFFENDKRGYRLATAVRASGTGKRGTCLIIDDPNNGMAGRAEVEATVEWFGKTWASRLNDQEKGSMIVVGQRLYSNDLTNHVLELGGWEHVNLPNEFEPLRKCFTSIGWEDPRAEEGQLLCTEIMGKEATAKQKKSLGALDYAAQYQQSPVPASGGHFKREWLRYFREEGDYYTLLRPDEEGGPKRVAKRSCKCFAVNDPAISEKQSADYTVIQIWAVTPETELLLLAQVRAHLDNPQQVRTIEQLHVRWLWIFLAVETVYYALALYQQLKKKGIPVKEYKPARDKVARASVAAVKMQAGDMYFEAGADYLHDLETEVLKFPKAPNDDQVDGLSMASDLVTLGYFAADITSELKQRADAREKLREKVQGGYW